MRIAAVAGPVAMLQAAVAAMILLLGLCDSPAAAAGCGSLGGPGYRGPDGRCVGWADIGRTCGNPPTVCTENSVLIDYVIESPNVSGDDRSVMLLADPVRLAVQVEEPA